MHFGEVMNPALYFSSSNWQARSLCIYVVLNSYNLVIDVLDSVLLRDGSWRVDGPIDWTGFAATMESSKIRRICAFSPSSDVVIFVDELNYYNSLIDKVCWRLRCGGYTFQFDSGAGLTHGQYLCAFSAFSSGKESRYVRTMLDDPGSGGRPVWKFFERGNRLAEESENQYESRLKRDRINDQALLALSGRFGYEFDNPEFWVRSEGLTYFVVDPWAVPAQVS